MAIYVDFILDSNSELRVLALMLENGVQQTFTLENIDEAAELLAEPGHIVTWDRPAFYLERAFDLDRAPILEDYPIKNRWFDIFSILRRETGLEPSLTKTATATLGFGPQSEVVKMPRSQASVELDPTTQVIEAMYSKLEVLRELYNYIKTNNELSFYHKTGEQTVEVDATEPSLLSE